LSNAEQQILSNKNQIYLLPLVKLLTSYKLEKDKEVLPITAKVLLGQLSNPFKKFEKIPIAIQRNQKDLQVEGHHAL
jgi:hypothetical protein